MERIQEAIAKARAARDGGQDKGGGQTRGGDQTGDAGRAPPSGPAGEPEHRTGLAATPQTADDADALAEARDAAWALLPPLTLSAAHVARQRIVTVAGGHEATHFDAMRTKVIQAMRSNGWRRLAITSPTAGCGKTTIALNLAFSLARQQDLRIVLAELDFRRPSMAKTLGFTPRTDLSRVLDGKAGFAEAAVRHGYNLALATNIRPVRNAAELLQDPQTATRLAAIEAELAPDLMIFDMPPMLVTDDAMAFAGQVDCALLVAAAETSTVKEIDTCERELASQTNVMGVILNKCRYMGPEYGYGYYG
jgi:protein-tyrosine kinase